MRKHIYLVITILAILSCSREEYLDIKPQGVIIPTKVSDYRLLLDQSDFGFEEAISPGFTETYSNTDLMSDDFSYDEERLTNSLSGVNLNAYTWADQFYTGEREDPDWQSMYGQIYVTNIILEEIMDATDGTMEEKLALQAEALLHRAFAYFILVNEYAVHYDPATADTDPGVPLRLTSELDNLEFPRASIQEVYDLILNDVLSAIDNLPPTPELKHRPSQASAYAFLARIYLYMGNFEAARDAANNALNISNTLLDYNMVGDWFFPGIIALPRFDDNPEILWFKKSTNPFNFLPLSDEAMALIEENDQRRRLFAGFFVFGLQLEGSVSVLSFPRGYRAVGFNVPELYLIRAETNARLGNTQTALEDLNKLRMHRFDTGDYTPLASEDPVEVLKWVKREKRIEYMARNQRLFDLKRYNVYDNDKTDIVHKLPTGGTVTLEANNKNWAVPIAQKYILENPEIGENQRD